MFSCDADILFRCSAFDIENVISNLISNSLVSFERENKEVLKEIKVTIEKRRGIHSFFMKTRGGD